tara:strand:- start:437 stop:772 length:336 start_codon:yes stop_codon:yes gene_type:complete
MAVLGILPFLLYLSILINIALLWYAKNQISDMDLLREDTLEIFKVIESFSDHLEDIHALEAFYGDQELQSLIEHSRSVINGIVDIQEKYYDDVETEMETYDDDEEEEAQEE